MNSCQLVSIIMPSYNSANTIAQSIKSVQRQDYAHWELLITDDCSSDSTVEIVRQLASQDPRISIEVNSVNSGAGFSRNQSINRSSGKYIAFLDADDLWLPNKLSTQVFIWNKLEPYSVTLLTKSSQMLAWGEY
ncbi:glycosyltransferase family 2 protein [Aeromonas caviae]